MGALKPPHAQRTTLAGPAGALQALIETPLTEGQALQPVSAFAVVCHPHPLYGGTLDNFRGVGASAGSYDAGRGETADALAVIAYGRRRWPNAALWLAGFSFGGAVAVRAAGEAGPQRLIAVAPGITTITVTDAAPPACPWLIVQGDADEVVPPEAVRAWAQKLSPAPEMRVLPGAGHFFHGRLNELRDVVLAFMASR